MRAGEEENDDRLASAYDGVGEEGRRGRERARRADYNGVGRPTTAQGSLDRVAATGDETFGDTRTLFPAPASPKSTTTRSPSDAGNPTAAQGSLDGVTGQPGRQRGAVLSDLFPFTWPTQSGGGEKMTKKNYHVCVESVS
jgi:hypothetical protein